MIDGYGSISTSALSPFVWDKSEMCVLEGLSMFSPRGLSSSCHCGSWIKRSLFAAFLSLDYLPSYPLKFLTPLNKILALESLDQTLEAALRKLQVGCEQKNPMTRTMLQQDTSCNPHRRTGGNHFCPPACIAQCFPVPLCMRSQLWGFQSAPKCEWFCYLFHRMQNLFYLFPDSCFVLTDCSFACA